MTNGELFIRENPTVETKINGSCVWIYFDGVNHYTMPVSWWDKEIGLFDKIRAELHATAELHDDGDYYLRDEWIDEIFDDYKAESEDKE